MTTVVAVCAGFGGWRLAPTEGSLVTCKDARRSAERQQVQDAGVNDACEIHPASLSSTSELEIDAGSANCCSGVMENLIPGDSSGSGRRLQSDIEQPLEDGCTDELPKEEDLSHPNPPDGPAAAAAHHHYSPKYATKVEYGLKLGYREQTIHAILDRFGPEISHDELLKELIERDKCTSADSRESFAPGSALTSSSQTEVLGEMAPDADGDASQLRAIVIDGSNVAMSHGNKTVFSCRGIGLAVDWFRQRGHREITVFVPQWRKENAKQDSLITDQEILTDLERQKILVFTPSRRVNNKRIICYDDRYVLKLAVDNNGIVVSNDNYRDLISENLEFKKVVEERLLMYSFVNDRFMPPDDPLGRYGPNIDSFLRKDPLPNSQLSQLCPYAKKCTYGNKCKFYHPERAQRPLVPISLQIANNSQPKIKEYQNRGCVSCSEKQPVGRAKSLGQAVSLAKPHGDAMDFSSLAISLLTGGKDPGDPKKGGGLERRSMPLPPFAPWSVRHENLRPVHSDPPGLSHPTRCSGHVALAKKLSDENCFMKSSAHTSKLSQAKPESNRLGSDNRHSQLCRKASLNASIVEGQERNFEMPLAQKVSTSENLSNGTILHSVTKERVGGEAVQSDRNNNDGLLSNSTGHSFVTRAHSTSVIDQETHDRTLCNETLSTSRSQQKVPLHRVSTSPLVLGRARAPPSSDVSTGRNPCFQGYPFIPQMGGTSDVLFPSADRCYSGVGWMQQPSSGAQNQCIRLSDFPQGRNNALMMASDISAGAMMTSPPNQKLSTFHFGRNSSFKFVPSAEPLQFFVPPGTNLPEIPSSFISDNPDDPKAALFFRLCGLFDRNDVYRVMLEHPNDMDSKSLCGHLLQLDHQRKQHQERRS